ncbi:hypothetical protein FUA48_16020 [Flavobacterium alkalisoli]|uniref:Uncharacterized protein n=1 Tax=Flavobacterium alkalisoli TaxID=2602769 RepID=A0A5B9G1T4_9FLAO|nr:hypothetical protein [Flavobacterium alkalisoli]QEE51027.1 hypothetical protein FUA48_16020 [Flavobacterium alkalisoli]
MVLNNNIKYNPIYFYGGKNELPNNHNFTVLANTSEVSFDWEGHINESKAISFGNNSITRQAVMPCNVVVVPNGRIIISAYVKMDDGLEPSTVPGNLDFAFTYNANTVYIPNHLHLGNGIYRVWINVAIAPGATITSISVYKNISAATAKSFKIYGLQLERANVLSDTPTAYTPTYGAALGLGKHKPFTIIRGNTIYGKKRLLYDTGMIFAKAQQKNFTAPDLREKLLINEFIKQEIRIGVWHKQDLYGLFAYNDPALMNFARINWRNPFGKGTIENLCTYSTYFTNSGWSYSGTGNIKEPNTLETTAPDGSFTACKFQFKGNPGVSRKTGIIANSTTLTYSIYTKSGTALTANFRLRDDTTSIIKKTGVINYDLGTITNGTIQNVGNGWFKISITATDCVIGNSYSIYYGDVGSTQSLDDIWYVWHPQLENNSYASDFIPTDATTEKGDNLFMLYGGLTYGAYGFEGNGLDGYIDTQFNPAIMGRNYTLNDASRMYVLYKDGGNSSRREGILASNRNCTFGLSSTTAIRINQSLTDFSGGVPTLETGLKALVRDSSEAVRYINGDTEYARTVTSSSIISANQILLGFGGVYGTDGMSEYLMGGSITMAQIQGHRANINNLLAGFGLNQIA